MREWLDTQRIEPHTFRHTTIPGNVTIQLQFKGEDEAAAFAQGFSGRLV